jgi:hypothetical protein
LTSSNSSLPIDAIDSLQTMRRAPCQPARWSPAVFRVARVQEQMAPAMQRLVLLALSLISSLADPRVTCQHASTRQRLNAMDAAATPQAVRRDPPSETDVEALLLESALTSIKQMLEQPARR